MNPSWPTRFLDYLELVDTQEAPHGLYGILRAYAPEGPLPTYARVLSGPNRIDLLKQCGLSNPSPGRRFWGPSTGRRPDLLSFSAQAKRVSLEILDCATTKVRHYGSAFRLDKRHHKQPRDSPWDLETLVPKLHGGHYGVDGILLIAHYASTKEITGIVGKTADPVFLDRYALGYSTREWDDRYGRGFRTALHLWVPRNDDAS